MGTINNIIPGSGQPGDEGTTGQESADILNEVIDKINNRDTEPTEGSDELIESGGVKSALDEKYDASNPDGFVDAAGAAAVAPVQSVAGRDGNVTLTKDDVGLNNVDNTSDVDKPISNDTQTALNGKLDDVQAGTGITIDKTNPNEPIINATAVPGAGDMEKSVYDPQNIEADAFDRDNHTGTQTANTISDFDNAVETNTDVAANTAARHDAVTLAGVPNYLTLAGQVITRNLIDLTAHVTERLGFGNFAQGLAHSIITRGAGNGNFGQTQIGEDRIIGRNGSGNIEGLTGAQVRSIIGDQITGYDRKADIGNIDGSTAISLQGAGGQPLDIIVATLTDAVTLSFTDLPPAGLEQSFVLQFTNDEEITFPAGTLYPDGNEPTPSGTTYQIVCSIDSGGVLTVYDVINDIKIA